MGEFFQQVHVWVVKNCTPWYMDGPDLIYRGTWMDHFSFKIGTWIPRFKIPRGTPLPRPKLSTPPGKKPPIWAAHPRTHLSTKYLPGNNPFYTLYISVPLGLLLLHFKSTLI